MEAGDQPVLSPVPSAPLTTAAVRPAAVVAMAAAPRATQPLPVPTDGEVLSAAGGLCEATPDVQRMLVLTSEGLFVSAPHATDLHVLSYKARLRQQSFPYRQFTATIDDITAAYTAHRVKGNGQRATKTGGHANSDEQREIVALLVDGLHEDASDIHFRLGKYGCDVKYRVLGELETRNGFTRDKGMRLVTSLYGSMCDIASQTFNIGVSQDARLSAKYTEGLGLYGARVATRPSHDGQLMVVRLLKADNRVMSLAELGFLPQQIALYEEMAARTYGVALISGPTGSGKSRTMQALMNHIIERDKGRKNVITIEDPPEYPMPGAVVTPLDVQDRGDPQSVRQAWLGAISNTMRLDPDILMVGEIRDLDSANAAFSAAMTGHILFSTLHSNDATSNPERLIDMNVEKYKVTDPTLLIGLSAQRLLPVLCPDCKIALSMGRTRLPEATYTRLVAVTPPALLTSVYVRGDGCVKCRRRGIVARLPVAETIMPNIAFMEEFRSSAADGKLRARRYWVDKMNGITMLRHALHLVWQGMVDPLNAEIVAPLDNDMKLLGVNYAIASQLV